MILLLEACGEIITGLATALSANTACSPSSGVPFELYPKSVKSTPAAPATIK